MSHLLAARLLMAWSLAFHILLAVAGMAMPLLLFLAEWKAQRGGPTARRYAELAKRWAKGTAILFAVGAVSGTALSFELGLLWPGLMELAGPYIGMPFTLEGYAFFFEAIFLGVYLYGGDRISPRTRLWCALAVAVSGLASGVLVVAVNAFMNSPGVSTLEGLTDPWIAFKSPAFVYMAIHMALAAYVSVGWAVSGVHAWGLLRGRRPRFHKAALRLSLGLAIVTTPLQIMSGDWSAKYVAEDQPVKFAAMEAHFETDPDATVQIGGYADEEAGRLIGAIPAPIPLCELAACREGAAVPGLLEFPRERWPNVNVTHLAFDLMVGCGMAMLAVAGLTFLAWWRGGRWRWHPRLLQAVILVSPAGLIALEAGWVTTEVGRQPWVIRGLLKTADAVTPVTGLLGELVGFAILFAVLGVVTLSLLRRHVFAAEEAGAAPRSAP